MKIRVGYELVYDVPQPTPMIMVLGTHFSRASDVLIPDHLVTTPAVPITAYRDNFGNWCSRIVAPKGQIKLSADGLVKDTGSSGHHRAFGQAACGGAPAGGDDRVSARQPLLRDRPPDRGRLEIVRKHAAGMGSRSGDLRLRAQSHHLRLRTRAFPKLRSRRSNKAKAYVATTRISPSPSAAA